MTNQAYECEDFHSEEVGCCDLAQMGLQEGLPRHSPASLGGWFDAVLLENPLDRVATDNVTDIAKCAADSRVAPPWIRLGHRDDKCPDSFRGTGTPGAASLAAVILLSDQLSVPTQDRVRGDNAAKLAQRRATEPLPFRREPAALFVSELEPLAAELLPKDAILLPEVLDDVALLAVRPAREAKQQEPQKLCAHDRQGSVPEAAY